jgi:hypothetical protein
MVDIAGRPAGTLSASDFDFKVGNNNTPSGWAALGAAPTVSIRAGAGVGGSDRVTLFWPTGAANRQWLQVTVKANANTGLSSPDVFYFGSAVGESGNVLGDYSVSIIDELLARNNPVSVIPGATATNRFDFNRDGTVSVIDQLLARNNLTTTSTKLQEITVPISLSASGLKAAALVEPAAEQPASHATSTKPVPASSVTGRSGQDGVVRLHPQALSALAEENGNTTSLPRRSAASHIDDELLSLLQANR